VSRMTVGGDTSEVMEYDEISVVSDDGGDEEINPNGNVWLRSGVQVQSYYRKLSIWKNVIRCPLLLLSNSCPTSEKFTLHTYVSC